MANTTNYALTKPTVGGDADVWGGYLNTNWDDADALFSAKATTGSANAYVLTTGLSLSAYATGQKFTIIPNFTNSGAATINVDAIGAKNLYRLTGGSLAAVSSGDVVSGVPTDIVYDGTQFVVVPRYEAQPIDADTTAFAALGYTSGSYLIKKTAANTYSLIAIAAQAEGFLDDATAAEQRTTLGVGSSDNPQFASIELGNASDTSMTRAAAGQVQVEGVYLKLAGKESIPIPASAMRSIATNGAASGTVSVGATSEFPTFDFDQTTQEYVQFMIAMPKGWNEGTVTFIPYWTAGSGTGGVTWAMEAVAFSDDDALSASMGSDNTSTDTYNTTANDLHIGPESGAITIGGSPSEGDLVLFQIRRKVADGSDTLTADARLIAIKLNITTNAPNDA